MSSAENIVASVLARLGDEQQSPEAAVPPTAATQQQLPPSADSASVAAGKKKKATTSRNRRCKEPEHRFPVEPRIIQMIHHPKSVMNHSYRDFSSVPPEPDDDDNNDKLSIDSMTFAQKVHHMLSQEEYKNWIAWRPHGRAFQIPIPKRLEQTKVLLKYFGHNRYSSFLRQLNNFGFKHISQGPDRNCYYHEFMLRGLPHLCKYMPRFKDARRLLPDPENEPDFAAITKMYPLPGGDADTAVKEPITTAAPVASWMQASPPTKVPRIMLGQDFESFITSSCHSNNNHPLLPNMAVAQASQLATSSSTAHSSNQAVLDVSQARNVLYGQQNQLESLNASLQLQQLQNQLASQQFQHELASQQLQKELAARQLEQEKAATLAAYAEFLQTAANNGNSRGFF